MVMKHSSQAMAGAAGPPGEATFRSRPPGDVPAVICGRESAFRVRDLVARVKGG